MVKSIGTWCKKIMLRYLKYIFMNDDKTQLDMENTFLGDCNYMYICLHTVFFIWLSAIWVDVSQDTLSVTWHTQNEAGAIPLTLIGCVVYLRATVIGHSICRDEARYEAHHYQFKMNFALRKVLPIYFEIYSSSRGSSWHNKHLWTQF